VDELEWASGCPAAVGGPNIDAEEEVPSNEELVLEDISEIINDSM